jgi:hypothetical protein
LLNVTANKKRLKLAAFLFLECYTPREVIMPLHSKAGAPLSIPAGRGVSLEWVKKPPNLQFGHFICP